MNRILLTFILTFSVFLTIAQPNCPSPFGKQYNANGFNRYNVSLNYGITRLKGDQPDPGTSGNVFILKFDYQFIKGLYFGVEGQYGKLVSYPSFIDKREVDSKFMSGGLTATVHPFEILANDNRKINAGKRLLNSIYVGAGFAMISNSLDSVYRDLESPESFGTIDYYLEENVPIFKKKVSATILPSINLGLAFPFKSSKAAFFSFIFNSQFNFANNDDLDGYVPLDKVGTKISAKNDRYNIYSVGLRYSF